MTFGHSSIPVKAVHHEVNHESGIYTSKLTGTALWGLIELYWLSRSRLWRQPLEPHALRICMRTFVRLVVSDKVSVTLVTLVTFVSRRQTQRQGVPRAE